MRTGGSVIENVELPVLAPEAVGVKVTEIVQFDPEFKVPAPQVLVWLKSPLMEMLAMVRAVLPVLASVTGTAGLEVPTVTLPKEGKGDGVITATGPNPAPVKLTKALPPFVFAYRVPFWVAAAVGLNVTVTLQLALGARVAGKVPQLSLSV